MLIRFKLAPLLVFVSTVLCVMLLLHTLNTTNESLDGVSYRFSNPLAGGDDSKGSHLALIDETRLSPAAQSPPPAFAIATFLTGQNKGENYFTAARLLVYQLLHEPSTRLKNPDIALIVLCGKTVPKKQRERLRKDGATVIVIEDVELPSWIHVKVERWAEQFTKLRVFQRTEFKRILYLDSDYLIMRPMDGIFDEPELQHLSPTLFYPSKKIHEDEGPLPKQWLFAARPDLIHQGGYNHTVPPMQTNYANAGFFLIHPDEEMFRHFMSVMQCEGRFDTDFMEQDMLDYVFRRSGPMPWRELNWKWSANFVNEADVEFGVHSLHGKFWFEGPEALRKRWRELVLEMNAYWGQK